MQAKRMLQLGAGHLVALCVLNSHFVSQSIECDVVSRERDVYHFSNL